MRTSSNWRSRPLPRWRRLNAAPTPIPRCSATRRTTWWLTGRAWQEQKNWKEAVAAFATRADILMNLAMRTRLASDETTLAEALVDLGDAWRASGDSARAEAQYERASDAVTRGLSVDPNDVNAIHQAVLVRGAQADVRRDQGDVTTALDHLEAAATLVWEALKREAWNPRMTRDHGQIAGQLDVLRGRIHGSPALPAARVAALDARIDALVRDHDPGTLVNWVMPPLMPGSWRNLVNADLQKAQAATHQVFAQFEIDQVFAVRAMPLEFRAGRGTAHDNLYKAGVEMNTGERGLIGFIARENGGNIIAPFVKLDGTSPPVHQMNQESAPLLDTASHAAAYLRFFVGMLQASDGPFTIVERPDDLLWRPEAPAAIQTSVRGRLVPLRVARQADGWWTGECTLIYAGVLFKAQFSLSVSGAVEMTDNEPLTDELPVSMERIVGVVKVLRQMSDITEERLAEARNGVQQAP